MISPYFNFHPAASTRQRKPGANAVHGLVQPLFLLSLVLLGNGLSFRAAASQPPSLQLRPVVQAGAAGVYLNELVDSEPAAPALRLTNPPSLTKPLVLSRSQVQ